MWFFSRKPDNTRRRLRAALEQVKNLLERVNDLKVRLASQQATIDWLQTRVNSLEIERAQLTERVLNVTYPVPQIERVEASDRVPAGRKPEIVGRAIVDLEIPDHLRESMAAASKLPKMGPSTPPRQMGPPDDYAASMAAHMANPDLFNDPGDAEAARQGIGHDDAGNVAYREG